jgi:hypothetical protein
MGEKGELLLWDPYSSTDLQRVKKALGPSIYFFLDAQSASVAFSQFREGYGLNWV